MSSYSRRLPVYLLLDCSESMAGEAIEDLQRGLDAMLIPLRNDPHALETVWLSVIAFSSYAKQVVPLTELVEFQRPKLSVRPGTALGAALQLLRHCLQRDVIRTTLETKGDYKPLVFLLSDGAPTDDWEGAADEIKVQRNPSLANISAVGCGPDADIDVLRRITDVVLQMKNQSAEAWKQAFVWLSASLQTTSQALGAGREGTAITLPSLPRDSLEIAPADSGPKDSRPRQMFLHACCAKTRQLYLMRYARDAWVDVYSAVCSHRLDYGFDEEGAISELPPISTDMLSGVPGCPFCGNPGASKCDCGALFCDTGSTEGTVVCPRCNMSLHSDTSGRPFTIERTEG